MLRHHGTRATYVPSPHTRNLLRGAIVRLAHPGNTYPHRATGSATREMQPNNTPRKSHHKSPRFPPPKCTQDKADRKICSIDYLRPDDRRRPRSRHLISPLQAVAAKVRSTVNIAAAVSTTIAEISQGTVDMPWGAFRHDGNRQFGREGMRAAGGVATRQTKGGEVRNFISPTSLGQIDLFRLGFFARTSTTYSCNSKQFLLLYFCSLKFLHSFPHYVCERT